MHFFRWYMGEILSKSAVGYNEFAFEYVFLKKEALAGPHDFVYIKEEESSSTHFNVYMNGERLDIIPVT